MPAGAPVLAINPCSSVRPRNYRNWLPARYAAVADHANAAHGCRIVLTGGPSPGEREFTDAVLAHMDADPIHLVGRTSLKQLLAVYRRCTALVAPDTGPAHVGTAAGIPVIGLYATSNPLRTGPYNSLQWTVNRYPENLERYCGQTVDQAPWGKRVRHQGAMAAITVEDVTGKIDTLMDGRQGTTNERE
ncbi:MAG: glycosyltransferase family 9 protein [Halofilum sp. (in: g-proteobacteria)]|nr:glycosyltransferase family 9 protein [Halofilum sp. (in: g-proteobacteria)]